MVRETAGGDHPEGSALDVLWSGILAASNSAPSTYESPAHLVGYRGGEVPVTPCAAGTSAPFWEENAFYCEDEHTILFDEAWLRDFSSRFGAFAPAAILAHEWGHHIQSFLGGSTYSIQFELQADCFAGIYLAASEQSSPGVFVLNDDLPTALQTFFDIGNEEYDASEWFGAAEHGSPIQRIMAFGTGYIPVVQSLTWCGGYRDFVPQDFAEIGPYRLLNLPGRIETRAGAAYEIAGNPQTGMSDIALTWFEELPLAGRGASVSQLHELRRISFPNMVALSDPLDLTSNVRHGTGVAEYFENHITLSSGSEQVQSGVFALASPIDGQGGLLIVATREVPAPTDLNDPVQFELAEEQFAAVYQVINRLCGPDESGDPSDPEYNVTCLEDQ
jgi:putative neutral zinc metallopeptidase